MYIPSHFSEERLDVLHQLIHDHPLASLVTMEAEGMTANHIPFIRTPPTPDAPFGTLRGHVARANPVWQNKAPVLLIFRGPSSYITPSWMEEKKQTGAVVPTYNYAVVHAHGTIATVDDTETVSPPLMPSPQSPPLMPSPLAGVSECWGTWLE